MAAPYRAAVAENDAALKELQAQEAAYNNKIAELEKAAQTGGVVQRNRAANEVRSDFRLSSIHLSNINSWSS